MICNPSKWNFLTVRKSRTKSRPHGEEVQERSHPHGEEEGENMKRNKQEDEQKLKEKREEIERRYEKWKEKGICPRCGGALKSSNPMYGDETAFSRHAKVAICPRCGMEEAIRDRDNAKRIGNDFCNYVLEELDEWEIMR